MIKGKVTIDLHNHNSGFTERIEKENMVTEALDHLIAAVAAWGLNANDFLFPLASKALGGLMLFDGKLTEDRKNIFFPSEAHLVASAGQAVNSSLIDRGSINAAESFASDTGFTTVWDFSTSQANGTIASLARTYCKEGQIPYLYRGYDGSTSMSRIFNKSGSDSFLPNVFHYDANTQQVYFIDKNGQGYYTDDSLPIYKENMPIMRFGAADHSRRVNYPEEIGKSIKNELSLASEYGAWIQSGYDGYCYASYTRGNSSGDGKIYYKRIKVSDSSFEESDWIEVTLKNCQLHTAMDAMRRPIINGGYIFARGYNLNVMYIAELSNPVNVRKVELSGMWFEDNAIYAPMRNGMLLVKVTEDDPDASKIWRYKSAFLYPDGKVVADANYRRSDAVRYDDYSWPRPFVYTYDDLMVNGVDQMWWSQHYVVNNYLGTICNLDTPIIKTASTSMKITYTLTDV